MMWTLQALLPVIKPPLDEILISLPRDNLRLGWKHFAARNGPCRSELVTVSLCVRVNIRPCYGHTSPSRARHCAHTRYHALDQDLMAGWNQKAVEPRDEQTLTSDVNKHVERSSSKAWGSINDGLLTYKIISRICDAAASIYIGSSINLMLYVSKLYVKRSTFLPDGGSSVDLMLGRSGRQRSNLARLVYAPN